jgi:ribosomal protein S6--L-glutamate ligase/tetrahydromethanopterin:alpha-L-glutamate ligase
MKIGLLTRNPNAWCSSRIIDALKTRGVDPINFSFSDITARVARRPEITIKRGINAVKDLMAVIVRPIGRGSLDEIIFRLDYLHRIERLGLPVINSPSSIEKAVDKYYALSLLEENGLKVPSTIVTEDPRRALDAFKELGGDVVVKPIFGSRGIGITRVSDAEIAIRIFRSLSFHHHVLYLQEFIPHGTRDIRAFVIGDKVIAAMYRIAEGWKTNISQGAKAVPFVSLGEVEDMAVRAAKTMGCEIAGVDIMEGPNGYLINEINSQPGFRGLQSTTDVDIAGEIVDHVLMKFCR